MIYVATLNPSIVRLHIDALDRLSRVLARSAQGPNVIAAKRRR